jgi:hypothetical protein
MINLDDDQATSLQAKIDRQKKELAKQRQKLAEYEEGKTSLGLLTHTDHGTVEDHDKDDDSSTESQDEEDMGYGARLGGGFTSAVSVRHLFNTNTEICCRYLQRVPYCTADR